ncbi:MAG: SDR family oxidoreductase [Gammaproteobacteria bacterium]|nr:SDR family oxidoreductase [Gammaproteobacteria bacterium]
MQECKQAIITGGASGIGRAVAERMVSEGLTVIIADVNAVAVKRTCDELNANGAHAMACAIDVADASECTRLGTDFGQIDILVACAGIQTAGTVIDTTEETWRRVLAVNLAGVANCCRAVLPGMSQRKSGSIVVVSSNNAVCGSAGMAAYDASKAGVLALVKSAAIEHGSDGVRVNAISPGTTITDYHIDRFAEQGVSEQQLEEMTAGTGLLNRAAAPEEIANAIWFLASNEASYITGTNLLVDGGFSLAGGH